MKAPEFWARRGLLARGLSPLGFITQAVTARRVSQPGFDAGIPVICAGNAMTGGSGKTILARDLLARLPERPFALTRGYGGVLAGPVLVDPAKHTALEVGDEALLLASSAPAILARDRAAGARLAVACGATAVVMDDGLQNPGLLKTVSFLVIDGGYGFGNGFLLPAGPLREPVSRAAARCQAAIMIGEDKVNAVAALPAALPVLRARLVADCAVSLQDRRVLAFAGIGRPAKFFDSVRELGGRMIAGVPFPDHHRYSRADAERLSAASRKHGAVLVTTEKDYVKLPALLRDAVCVVTVRLDWADLAALDAILRVAAPSA